jgi:hypothetical protein
MRYHEIVEGSEQDLNWLAESNRIQRVFTDYLRENNTNKVLEQCGFRVSPCPSARQENMAIATISMRELGMREYKDLSLGFSWNIYESEAKNNKARGYHFVEGYSDGSFYHYVTLHIDHNPMMDRDVSWEVQWDAFPHEMQHYFDHKRGYNAGLRKKLAAGKSTQKDLKGAAYFNDALEYNAHFVQGMVDIFRDLVRTVKDGPEAIDTFRAGPLSSFKAFQHEFLCYMPKNFHLYLDPEMLKRFNKRFYKLYTYVKDGFPDLAYIKSELEHDAAMEARWAAEDAA